MAGNFPWLLIDLGDTYHVTGVQITNGDALLGRLFVKLGDVFDASDLSTVDRHLFKKVTEMNNLQPSETRKVLATQEGVRRVAGRYVLITLKSRNAALSLCDVQIYGEKTSNLALKQRAWQSSTIGKIVSDGLRQGDANRTVDGKRLVKFSRNSCSHTATDNQPWWTVDLGEKTTVFDITITNRNDTCTDCWKRLHDFDVLVGDEFDPVEKEGDKFNRMTYDFTGYEVIATVKGTLGMGTHTLVTKRHAGRYLAIRLQQRGILTLCEVEIEAVRA